MISATSTRSRPAGQGDWEEGKYWLDKIVEYCRIHRLPHVIVPVPYAPSMFSQEEERLLPGEDREYPG